MRSMSRQRQRCWYSQKVISGGGFDRKETYTKPVMEYLVVSATAGDVDNLSAGLVPAYDRVITSFKKLPVEEGFVWWIDRVPELDESGELSLGEDGAPVTLPDYTLAKILETQKGMVSRFGIAKIGGT